MVGKRLALGMGLALLVGGATVAGAQTAAPMAGAPVAKPVKPKRICRKETPVGTIMPVSTCHTKEEWSAIDGRNSDAATAGRDIRGGVGGQVNGGGVGSN